MRFERIRFVRINLLLLVADLGGGDKQSNIAVDVHQHIIMVISNLCQQTAVFLTQPLGAKLCIPRCCLCKGFLQHIQRGKSIDASDERIAQMSRNLKHTKPSLGVNHCHRLLQEYMFIVIVALSCSPSSE